MSHLWPIGILTAGFAVVAVISGCVRFALPELFFSPSWLVGSLVPSGPYILAAVACRRSRHWSVRVIGVGVVLAGLFIGFVAVVDAWPTFFGGERKGMFASVIVSPTILICQYWAGGLAVVSAAVARQFSLTADSEYDGPRGLT